MRLWVGVVAVLVMAPVTWGAEPANAMDELTKQFVELDRSEFRQKQKRIEQELLALQQREDQQRRKLQEELRTLEQSEEGQAYAERRRELEARRSAAWQAERGRIAEAAKQLYRQRHGELLSLAAGELVDARELELDVLSYPRIDGSTSTHPLSVVIACRILGAPYQWAYPEPLGSRWGVRPLPQGFSVPGYVAGWSPEERRRWTEEFEFTLAAAKLMADVSDARAQRLAIMINSFLATSASTHGAYLRLISGECDLNLTVREPSDDEKKAAADKGVELELVPVARDALVFIANAKNPVWSLTRRQIRGIYDGEVRNWQDVGGDRGEIHALWRERNSGSRELFDAAIGAKAPEVEVRHTGPDGLASTAALPWGKRLYALGMTGPFSQLTHDRDGLAYSVWYYERYMAMSPHTRVIAVDGVEPTEETIRSGAYPLVTKVFAAYRKGEKQDSPTMRLVRWLVSAEGQKVVRESGYVGR